METAPQLLHIRRPDCGRRAEKPTTHRSHAMPHTPSRPTRSPVPALALLALALCTAGVVAQPKPGDGQTRERRGPPAEALAACKSLASGAACEFTGPRGSVSGTCFAPQQGLALACRPKDAPAPNGAASGPKR